MTTSLPQSGVTTLDKFFTKIYKEPSDTPKTASHKEVRSSQNNKRTSASESVNYSEMSDSSSSSENNEKSEQNKTLVITRNSSLPEIRKTFSDKNNKVESITPDKSEINKNLHNSESSSGESSEEDETRPKGMQKSSGDSSRHSINATSQISPRKKPELIKRENKDHTLSDDEKKDVPRSPLKFIKKDSVGINSPIKQNSSDDSDSDISINLDKNPSRNVENPSNYKQENWLEQLKGKMTPVQHMADADYSKALHLEDISDEEDLFLIQCPKEIDPNSLRKKEIILDGLSSILLKKDGHTSRYDSFIVNGDSERLVDLLLRSKDNSKLQLGRFPLSGYVILSQSIEVPALKTPTLSPNKKVQYPEKLEKLCLSLPAADSPSDSSTLCNVVFEVKKRSKKKIKQERGVSNSSDSGIESPKKKHSNEDSNLGMESFSASALDSLLSSAKMKKKRKKIKEEDNQIDESESMPPPSETASENRKKRKRSSDYSNEYMLKSAEYPAPEDLATNVHKKRKKKHRDSDSQALENSLVKIEIKTEPVDTYDEIDTQLVKKKKKKSLVEDPESECYPAPDLSVKVKCEPEEDSFTVTRKKKKKSKSRDE